MLHSDQLRGRRHELKYQEILLKHKVFVTARQIEHWGRLHRGASEGFSILGNIQKLPGHSPEQPAVADSALGTGIALDDVQGSLPTSAML